MNRTALAAIVATVALGAAGCSQATRDLEGINGTTPDKTIVYLAPDEFPNIAVTCIAGVAILTTTRDYQQSTVVPELAPLCHEGR